MNRFLSPALLVPALCLGLWGTARPAAAALSANGVLENITLLAHPYTALFGTDAKPTSAAALSPQQCLDKVKQEWLAYQKTEGKPGPPGSVPPADQSQRQTLYEGVRNICLQRLALEQEFALLQRQPAQGPADPNGPLAPKSRPQPAPWGAGRPRRRHLTWASSRFTRSRPTTTKCASRSTAPTNSSRKTATSSCCFRSNCWWTRRR